MIGQNEIRWDVIGYNKMKYISLESEIVEDVAPDFQRGNFSESVSILRKREPRK